MGATPPAGRPTQSTQLPGGGRLAGGGVDGPHVDGDAVEPGEGGLDGLAYGALRRQPGLGGCRQSKRGSAGRRCASAGLANIGPGTVPRAPSVDAGNGRRMPKSILMHEHPVFRDCPSLLYSPLDEGDLVFFPAYWYDYFHNLEPSISVTTQSCPLEPRAAAR